MVSGVAKGLNYDPKSNLPLGIFVGRGGREMKKLILVLIMILLGSSWIAVADEELDYVVGAEEGSSYYNQELGAKLMYGAQDTDTAHYTNYSSQELNELQQIMAVSNMPAGSVNVAFLEPAIGEGMQGTEAAVAAYQGKAPPFWNNWYSIYQTNLTSHGPLPYTEVDYNNLGPVDGMDYFTYLLSPYTTSHDDLTPFHTPDQHDAWRNEMMAAARQRNSDNFMLRY